MKRTLIGMGHKLAA